MKPTDEYKICSLEEAEEFAKKREKGSEHGYCPNCKADLDGGSIWEHFYKLTGSEEKADKSAEAYGATKEKGQWGRAVGIYDRDLDRTVAWFCPDCHHKWGRV